MASFGGGKQHLVLSSETGYDVLNDGLPIKKLKLEQVGMSRPPCSPAAPVVTATAASAATPSPISPSQPMASSAPPAYPQRGQPAQTPQQTLPTIPEVHEEADHCAWPAAARAALACGAASLRPALVRPRGGSPPQQQQQRHHTADSQQQRQQQQKQLEHQLEPVPDLDLAAAAEEEQLPSGKQQECEQEQEQEGNVTDESSARSMACRRRRLETAAGYSWVMPSSCLIAMSPTVPPPLAPEQELVLHQPYAHGQQPGHSGWAVVSPTHLPEQQQQMQQPQMPDSAAELWRLAQQQQQHHHQAQELLHHQLLQAQQKQELLNSHLQPLADVDTTMLVVGEEPHVTLIIEALPHKLSSGGVERCVSLECQLQGTVERHSSGCSSLEQRLSGGVETVVPPTLPAQQQHHQVLTPGAERGATLAAAVAFGGYDRMED